MDNLTNETKQIHARKDKVDMKLGQSAKSRKCHDYGVTRKEFHALIKKASQPIKREAKSDSEKSQT